MVFPNNVSRWVLTQSRVVIDPDLSWTFLPFSPLSYSLSNGGTSGKNVPAICLLCFLHKNKGHPFLLPFPAFVVNFKVELLLCLFPYAPLFLWDIPLLLLLTPCCENMSFSSPFLPFHDSSVVPMAGAWTLTRSSSLWSRKRRERRHPRTGCSHSNRVGLT